MQNEIGHVFFFVCFFYNFKDNYDNFVIVIVFLYCNFIVYKRLAQELADSYDLFGYYAWFVMGYSLSLCENADFTLD